MLKRLNQFSKTQLRKTLRSKHDKRVLFLLTECLFNILKGAVPVRIKKIKMYEKISNIVLRKSTTVERRRAVFLSKLGFKLVQHFFTSFTISLEIIKCQPTVQQKSYFDSKKRYLRMQQNMSRMLGEL